VLRGALLELITVGSYRFGLATDIRRHMWHNTSVDGDALEYTGVAKELFFGALLALAIFAPLTEERLASMAKDDQPAQGPELMSAAEWMALRTICR